MNLDADKSTLELLKIERDNFESSVKSVHRRFENGDITHYQKYYHINTITAGLDEKQYINKLNAEISYMEKDISKREKNLERVKYLVYIAAMLLFVYVVILFARSDITGMVIYDNTAQYETVSVNQLFTNYNAASIALKNNERTIYTSQLEINNIIGEEQSKIDSLLIDAAYYGTIRVYLNDGPYNRYLVFDSKTTRLSNNNDNITGEEITKEHNRNGNAEYDDQKNIIKWTSISNVCDNTCNLNINSNNATLLIELEHDSGVFIESIKYSPVISNKKTVIQHADKLKLLKNISNVQMSEGKFIVEIDLSQYFSIPNNKKIIYNVNSLDEVNTEIDGNTLRYILRPDSTEGAYEDFVTATDGKDIIQSNNFNVIIKYSPKESQSTQ